MAFKERTTDLQPLVMVSSPPKPTHDLALALSSPPTPTFDSPPSGPSSPLVSNSVSPPLTPSDSSQFYPESRHLTDLASSVLKLIDERKEEFHYSFGHLVAAVERLKSENAKREGVIKLKRDSMVMLDNLIRMQEKDLENLVTSVNTAKAGGQKELPMPASEVDGTCTQNSPVSPPRVISQLDTTSRFAAHILPSPMEPYGIHQLPCAPTSLSSRPVETLSAKSHLALPYESSCVPDRGVYGAVDMSAMKVAKVEKKATEAGDTKKMLQVGAGDVPAWSAGEVAVKKMTKAVSSDPKERHTNCVPVSTPFKGRVGLTKNFKGKLHDVMIVNSKKRPSSSSPALLSMTGGKSPLKTEKSFD